MIYDIYYNVCHRNYKATIDNILKLEHAKWYVYGQSWSTVSESDAMWRIYSYNRHSIQIKTTDRRLEKILSGNDDISYVIKSIKYDIGPEDNLMHMQVQQLKETLSINEPFLHKRKAFKHEAEKRVLIDDKRWYQMMSMSSMGANWKIYEKVKGMSDDAILEEIESRLNNYLGHVNENNIACDYYIYIADLSKYISSVKVNPFAEDWYVELIGNLCAEYNLQFQGRSELYKRDK